MIAVVGFLTRLFIDLAKGLRLADVVLAIIFATITDVAVSWSLLISLAGNGRRCDFLLT